MHSSQHYAAIIAQELGIVLKSVTATIALLDADATVPFIARYRKEQTGSLDEVAILNIRDRFIHWKDLDKRKEAIKKSMLELGKWEPEFEAKWQKASTFTELEDLYLPFKPKRKTRAIMAKEKGLEPLALWLLEQDRGDVLDTALKYVSEEKGVQTVDEALAGARDILAEKIMEDPFTREQTRKIFQQKSMLSAKVYKGKEVEAQKYKDYFQFEALYKDLPSHRLLALRRGEQEMFLSLDIAPEEILALEPIQQHWVKNTSAASDQVSLAIKDGYKRLLKPSLETELRMEGKLKADIEAIHVFAQNIRELLMASPLGPKVLIAIDPGFRTGCKMVLLDAQGTFIANKTIFPHEQNQIAQAQKDILHWVEKYKVEAIVVGNGTAGRETLQFVQKAGLPSSILALNISESGASIYSASEVAREEFPDLDLTIRGAISIGRRLMDPLAELVKCDPKSIGVGQYQHDVDQNLLKQSLDDVVISCVNAVGVEVNSASKQLLTYVSGVGPALAQQIVQYRQENGPFTSRSQLKKVPRLGEKVYEQCAGFLRVKSSKNPLDQSAVHPERYALVERMAKDVGIKVEDFLTSSEARKKVKLTEYISTEVGLPTLQDIFSELEKPGRDPRAEYEVVAFEEGVNEMKDLKVGMQLTGIVTNVTNFGAFVDIGVHQDGLVHISHLSDQFVKDPHAIVKVQQKVQVTVTEVEISRKRIALSMKKDPFGVATPKKEASAKPFQPRKEEKVESEVTLDMLKAKFGR